jgi:peptidoglycan/LPS O-acetylase OafA/YrhL
MRYRPEIDGLRAVAVLPVILFHAGFAAFPGGFVGVDIFFVISGYLITGILIDEIGSGRFSIVGFYERRARRILPALFAVLLACLPFAWMWLLDEQLSDFAASLAAVLVFLSNIFFMSQVSYFAPAAELQPLLHTWSLSVEEQYYLLFPLIVALSLRAGVARLFAVVLALTLASLAISEVGIRLDAGRNFFFTLSRFWELGLGSLCAVAVARWGERRNGPLALAGLGMILASIFLYHADLPFAGVYALLPVGGAMLIVLHAQAGTLAARILSHPLPVGIGLISYSAYLVHQPLFAFARIRSPEEPGTLLLVTLTLASLGLGWLSWRYVERPFRGTRPILLAGRKALFGSAALVAAALMVVAVTLRVGEGFPGRMAERYAGELGNRAFYNDTAARYFPCMPQEIRDAAPTHDGQSRCFQSRPDGPVSVVVLGDSHAEHLFPGVADGLPDETVAIYLQNAVPFRSETEMSAIYAEVARNPDLKAVIFAMHWPRRFEETGDPDRFRDGLRDTLQALTAKGVKVLVAGDLPWFASEPPACKYEVVPGNLRYCTAEREDALALRSVYGPILADVAAETGAKVVPLRDLFCDGDRCSMVRDGVIQFRDSNHLNATGARLAGGRLAEAWLSVAQP